MPLITEGSALGWLFEGRLFFSWKRSVGEICLLVMMVNTYQALATFRALFLALCEYLII